VSNCLGEVKVESECLRRSYPVEDLKRTLDAMSWAKINHFHWHIVDAQSFPLVIPGFEEIAEKAAYSASQVYTPANVKDIVSFAAAVCVQYVIQCSRADGMYVLQRGIDVIVEIDTPGHTTSIAESHPEFIACPFASPWDQFANGSLFTSF